MTRRAELGAAGEAYVAAWFEGEGYEVHDRNWSCRVGELDMVVSRVGVLVFVEVRTVSTRWLASPTVTIQPAKQARIARAADAWLQAAGLQPTHIRFDVVGVFSGGKRFSLEHIEDAFVPPWAF
jgi:putative endonuclease